MSRSLDGAAWCVVRTWLIFVEELRGLWLVPQIFFQTSEGLVSLCVLFVRQFFSGSEFAEYFCPKCNFWDDVSNSERWGTTAPWLSIRVGRLRLWRAYTCIKPPRMVSASRFSIVTRQGKRLVVCHHGKYFALLIWVENFEVPSCKNWFLQAVFHPFS